MNIEIERFIEMNNLEIIKRNGHYMVTNFNGGSLDDFMKLTGLTLNKEGSSIDSDAAINIDLIYDKI